MKKYLIPKEGNFSKANLHSHSVISDGADTPEHLKEEYKKMGYQVYAYTDHDVFIPHNDLTDDDFLALNGYEVEINDANVAYDCFERVRCCHLCFIALDRDMTEQVCLHRKWYMFGNAPKYARKMNWGSAPDYVREYNAGCINDMIRRAKAAGFFVSYNHPAWSMEYYPQYMSYDGFDALEIYNGGCIYSGFGDMNGRVYDEMLNGGKRPFVTGSDDNHPVPRPGDPSCECGSSFTMIKAKKLDYPSIADALKKGHFYASMGPEIKELTFENDVVTVECSPARTIELRTDIRSCMSVRPGAVPSTHAELPLHPYANYFRVVVTDERGRTAETHAYFRDEL